MPDSRPSSRGSRPGSKQGARREGRPQSAPEPPPPLPTHPLTLEFDFAIAAVPPPPPPEPAEGEEPPAEGEEPPRPPLEGTYFELALPAAEFGSEPAVYKLKHPLSGEGVEAENSIDLTIDDRLIRWIVEDVQGLLPLSLKKPSDEGGDDVEVCSLPVDVGPLIFGKQSVRAHFDAPPAAAPWPASPHRAARRPRRPRARCFPRPWPPSRPRAPSA